MPATRLLATMSPIAKGKVPADYKMMQICRGWTEEINRTRICSHKVITKGLKALCSQPFDVLSVSELILLCCCEGKAADLEVLCRSPDFVAKDGLSQTMSGTNTHSRLPARAKINTELIGQFAE